MEKLKCKILKNKDKIKSEWLNNERSGDSKRKLRKPGNKDINATIYDWFLDSRSQYLPISGPVLQAQAKLVAKRLNKEDFKVSNGWLESFRVRHEITFGQISGEANDVDMDVVNDWKVKIKSLIADYQLENNENCDEKRLYFRALPNNTLKLKGKDVSAEGEIDHFDMWICRRKTSKTISDWKLSLIHI